MVLASSIAGLFKWRQFEPEVILLAVGWYLRFSLSYRDVEELLVERGISVDHVTLWRWVQRYAPALERRLRKRLMYQQARRQAGRAPSVVIMDGQSVKTTERGGIRGFDAHKRVKGRKRHILVDTFGLLIACSVEPADISDRKAAARLLGGLRPLFPNIRTVIADAGHQSRKLAHHLLRAKTAGSCRSSNAGSARSRSQASHGLWSAASLGLAAIDD